MLSDNGADSNMIDMTSDLNPKVGKRKDVSLKKITYMSFHDILTSSTISTNIFRILIIFDILQLLSYSIDSKYSFVWDSVAFSSIRDGLNYL